MSDDNSRLVDANEGGSITEVSLVDGNLDNAPSSDKDTELLAQQDIKRAGQEHFQRKWLFIFVMAASGLMFLSVIALIFLMFIGFYDRTICLLQASPWALFPLSVFMAVPVVMVFALITKIYKSEHCKESSNEASEMLPVAIVKEIGVQFKNCCGHVIDVFTKLKS